MKTLLGFIVISVERVRRDKGAENTVVWVMETISSE
jgi:hypothetical protein